MARKIFVAPKKLSELSPAKWYFKVNCRSCGRPIALLEDTSRGEQRFELGETLLMTECPHCGKRAQTYRSDDVQSLK